MKAIYGIVNIVTHKIYIGSALDVVERYYQHFNALRHNKHYNVLLQKAFNKYGESNFVFVIIEEVCKSNLLTKREQYWMDEYKSYIPKFGYNLKPFANSMLGFRHSAESKEKMRVANLGKNCVKRDDWRFQKVRPEE